MDGADGGTAMIALLVLGGTLSVGGIVLLVADAGVEGARVWAIFGRQVQSTLVGIGSFVTGALMMAASMLITASSGGMLSGDAAIAAAGDYWPETEPNDDWQQAQPLPDGERLVGNAEPGDRDRFVVLADPRGPALNWQFRALDESGLCGLTFRRPGSPPRQLAAAGPGADPMRGELAPGPGRELYFGVEGEAAETCRYLLHVRIGQ